MNVFPLLKELVAQFILCRYGMTMKAISPVNTGCAPLTTRPSHLTNCESVKFYLHTPIYMFVERWKGTRVILLLLMSFCDRLCGLVVRVRGYRSRGPGAIPGATRFFLRSSGSGTGSTQPRDDN
jgi:hypothetical protein